MKAMAFLLLGIALIGCSAPPPEPAPTVEKIENTLPDDPVAVNSPLYDQLHSGLFQADAAVKKIADALDSAQDIQKKLPPDIAGEMKEMIGVLDDSGAVLADKTGGEPPTKEQVTKKESEFKKKRDDLVNTFNDILHDMREQEGVAASMAEMSAPEFKKGFEHLDQLLTQIIDDLIGALKAMGANEEMNPNAPDTGDTNQPPPPGYSPPTTG